MATLISTISKPVQTSGKDKGEQDLTHENGIVTPDGHKDESVKMDIIDKILNGANDAETDNQGQAHNPHGDNVKDGCNNHKADEGILDKAVVSVDGGGRGPDDKVEDRKGDQLENTENESWLPFKEWHFDTDTQVRCLPRQTLMD